MKRIILNHLNISTLLLLAIFFNISFLFYAATNVTITDRGLDIYKYGQLVQPFHVHTLDRFMDYYNVNYHALNQDFYSGDFRSVYTEIFRIFSITLTPNECKKVGSSLLLKSCDSIIFYLFYISLIVINLFLLYKKLIHNKNKFLWIILFSVSFPLWYTFERGNYIILSMLLLNLLILKSDKKNIFLVLFLLPFTKIYLITTYFILFIQKFSKFLIFLFLFLILNLTLFIFFNDNPLFMVRNLLHFDKDERVYDIILATSFIPIVKSFKLRILIFFVYILYFSVLIRAFIYINTFISHKSHNYMDLIFLILLLLPMIIPSVGFYFIILLFPFFALYIAQDSLSNNSLIFIILLCIPYPINLVPYRLLHSENIIIYIQLQSIFIPLLLLLIFYQFTKKIEVSK